MHRRYGTVLYAKNGDLITSLSWAWAQSTTDVTYETTPSNDAISRRAGDIVNDLVHTESDWYSQLDAKFNNKTPQYKLESLMNACG